MKKNNFTETTVQSLYDKIYHTFYGSQYTFEVVVQLGDVLFYVSSGEVTVIHKGKVTIYTDIVRVKELIYQEYLENRKIGKIREDVTVWQMLDKREQLF